MIWIINCVYGELTPVSCTIYPTEGGPTPGLQVVIPGGAGRYMRRDQGRDGLG